MRYKILTFVVLSNLLSTAYAINPRMNSPVPNAADPYQYCFRNTTWIVPPETLLAYLYNNGSFAPVNDQTVWVFANYNQGYFSGESYTSIDNGILSQRFLVGSVTSDGRVLITFYSGSSSSTDLVSGWAR